jgi:hypothetical protein
MGASREPNVRTVRYWRCRYLDPSAGSIVETSFQPTAAQAGALTEAEPIPASMRDVNEFADTLPLPFERTW